MMPIKNPIKKALVMNDDFIFLASSNNSWSVKVVRSLFSIFIDCGVVILIVGSFITKGERPRIFLPVMYNQFISSYYPPFSSTHQ